MSVELLSHVPKRATQHAIFLGGKETAPTSLKCGQTQDRRQDFYTTAASSRPLRQTYLTEHQMNASIYDTSISKNGIPADYLEAHHTVAKEPITLNDSDLGPEPLKDLWRRTDHWRSEYDGSFRGEQYGYKRQRGAVHEPANPPSCVSMPVPKSMYQSDLGMYGEKPRDKFPSGATSYPSKLTDLTPGTTTGTCHIPGYQGFLPTNTHNRLCARIAYGEDARSKPLVNITEIYHQNVPNYTGHVPVNARNDLGPRQVVSTTTTGQAYTQAKWNRSRAGMAVLGGTA
jgi:hypothetical protein